MRIDHIISKEKRDEEDKDKKLDGNTLFKGQDNQPKYRGRRVYLLFRLLPREGV